MALPAGLENQSFCFVQVGDAVFGWPNRVLLTRSHSEEILVNTLWKYPAQLIIHHGGLVRVIIPSLWWVRAGKVWFISVSNEIVNCYVFCCVLCQTSKTSTTTSVNKEGEEEIVTGAGQQGWLDHYYKESLELFCLFYIFPGPTITGYLELWSFLGKLCQQC